MVDSRIKGATAETKAKELLVKYTKLNWQRTPGSGALNEVHMMKGDLYIPNCNNNYCVEVKHYKDDQITSKLLTGTAPIFLSWWYQTESQAIKVGKLPLLIFKFDRSKWFVAGSFHSYPAGMPQGDYKYFEYCFDTDSHPVYIALLEDFLSKEDITWIL